MKIVAIIFLFSFIVLCQSSLAGCKDWFVKLKIDKNENCLAKCATAKVDMSSFECHDKCDDLCELPKNEKILFEISELYPGLTPAERALAASEPVKALKAYQLSWQAEKLCLSIFESSQTNDESDACRHFVWAGLLSHELGQNFASLVLDAHEQIEIQPKNERAMDLANNRLGLLLVSSIEKQKGSFEQNLVESFEKNLKADKFILLNHKPDNIKKKQRLE